MGLTSIRQTGLLLAMMWGVIAGGSARADEGADLWLWQDVTLWQREGTRFHLFFHEALADGTTPSVFLASPRLKHRPAPWLELGAGFSLLRITRGEEGEGFFNQERPELEFNPMLDLGGHWRLHLRNRAEVRWNEWQGKPRPRWRHRLQLTRDIDGLGPVQAFYFSNEWLIEQDRGDWTENRLIPAALSFRLTESVSVDLWHMLRSFRFDGGWTHDHVIGMLLRVSL